MCICIYKEKEIYLIKEGVILLLIIFIEYIYFKGDNMKRIIFIIVVMFIIATFFIIGNKNDNNDVSLSNNESLEYKAIFFSYIEINKYIKNNNKAKENIDLIIDNLSNDGFNLILLHVRSFSDSIYNSSIFPNYLNLDFDVLDYFIKKAHAKKIDVHAWINPYRISSDKNFIIEESHPAYSFLNTTSIKRLDNGVYYNPASLDVTNLIVSGVEEIVSNYDVDGIIFDDYFYPSKDIDNEEFLLYKDSGGDMNISEYRMSNISNMISSVYSCIKKNNKDVLFGISPQGNISNNYNNEYLDVKKILSEEGYIDYIMPQIYFGFNNSSKPFIDTVKEWSSLITNKKIMLIPALSLYKSGSVDKYAGGGSNEWIDSSDIIKRQIIYSRNIKFYYGFSLFRYDHFYNSNNLIMKDEVSNIKSILQSS